VKIEGWVCIHPDGEIDHDWRYRRDSAGDHRVIGGIEDIGWWECEQCGATDEDREPPMDDDYYDPAEWRD
jgi:hypothetical protein